MSKYETYSEKKWLERHGIWKDSVYLREENGRVKNKQRRKHRSGKSIMKKHLEDVGMNYTMHLRFAWILALKLFLLSLIALVHGIFPFILVHLVSDGVKSLDSELKSRDHQ
jgi:hypothetical protein